MDIIKRLALVALLAISLPALSADKLNINTATAQQLATTMKGVGKQKAELIVDYRHKNGPFLNLDQLKKVKGIGAKTIDDNQDKLIAK